MSDRDDASALDLAVQLLGGYQSTGRPDMLELAVELFRAALAEVPADSPIRFAALSNLATALQLLFELTDDLGTLTEVAQLTREAADAVPPGHPNRTDVLTASRTALHELFERTGEISTLREAVTADRRLLAELPAGAELRTALLNNLAIALQSLFESTGDIGTLAEAVDTARAALDSQSADDPSRAICLGTFAGAARTLAARTGDISILAEAVDAARAGLAAAAIGHPGRSSCLSTLGNALVELFAQTGDRAALAEAVLCAWAAVDATGTDDPDRAARLSNLGVALRAQFLATGDAAALAEAVTVARAAVEATPAGDRRRAARLAMLSNALQEMFEQAGRLDLLVRAVDTGRAALGATPVGHPDRLAILNNLGVALRILGERTGELDVLVEAVHTARAALDATPADHPGRQACLTNLAVVLQTLAEVTGEPGPLVEAVDTARAALDAAPADHPDRTIQLAALARVLKDLFEQTGEAGALIEAAHHIRDAVEATPDDSLYRAVRVNQLGDTALMVFECTGQPAALDVARRCYREAGRNVVGATITRINAYRSLAALPDDPDDAENAESAAADDPGAVQERVEAIAAAVDLVDIMAPATLSGADREHQLRRLANLPGEAAAVALDADRPALAVELLERARGRLTADVLGMRGEDLARLRADDAHRHQADRLEQLRSQLDTFDRADASPDESAELRRAAHAEWRQLLDEIRAVPGFAGFFRTPAIADLARQAHAGPIVFVTTGPDRCDALILTDSSEPVRVVPLRRLTQQDAFAQATRLMEARRTAASRDLAPQVAGAAQQEVLDVLAWLWDTVAEPVLEELGHHAAPGADELWPRVWWCPVGVMAFLPIHAAGRYAGGSGPEPGTGSESAPGDDALPKCVLDRVVSSYIPTVRALARARAEQEAASARTSATTLAAPTTLIVPVADLPGAELPGVTAESVAMRTLIPDARLLADPTRDAVLKALPGHRIVHFACHGHADGDRPAASRLILTDYATAPLTVADITALDLTADLAYLSACDTTVTAPLLADESLHITGAFQLAGYRHVIGTMWSVDDRVAADTATAFYDYLTEHGATPPQTDLAAYALHHAVRRMRDRHPEAPTLWAAHTHTGV